MYIVEAFLLSIKKALERPAMLSGPTSFHVIALLFGIYQPVDWLSKYLSHRDTTNKAYNNSKAPWTF